MGRRGNPAKGRAEAKRPLASTSPLAAVRDLEKRLAESLEREKAAGEILRVISNSSASVQPTFEAIAHAAISLCEADIGSLFRFDGHLIHLGAFHGTPEELEASRRAFPQRPGHRSVTARAILAATVVQIDDVSGDPETSDVLRMFRTVLSVPMIRDGQALGAITVARRVVRPFSNEQIALLQTFADQAVIAIENVRLFTELETSNRELTTALDTQTATSDILRVISRSQTDVQPVFDAIVQSAVRLLGAYAGILTRLVGDHIVLGALTTTGDAGDAALRARYPLPLDSGAPTAQVIRERRPLNIPDAQNDPGMPDTQHIIARTRGYRGLAAVPLLRHNEPLGAIAITRREAGRFTEDEIALLQTFADQAVIAIENMRLFRELETRNRDLTQALEQQTATSEILRVISSSPGDLRPVFEAMLANAVRLCEASFGNLLRYDGDAFRHVALHNAPPGWAAEQESDPVPPRDSARVLYRVPETKQHVHVADIAAENPDEPVATIAGARTLLIVPMLKENTLIGVIAAYRQEVRPFSEQQIDLLQTFADQAVIAIENVRLFTELQARNNELTATSEILRVISTSPTDVQPVFDTIVASAVTLCEARFGAVFVLDQGLVTLAAHHNFDEAQLAVLREQYPMPPSHGYVSGRTLLTGATMQIADASADEEYRRAGGVGAAKTGFQSLLGVPMLRGGQAIGAILIYRKEPGEFADKHVALLQTFADQAVIAVENVRLFTELQTSNRELTTALDTQTATSDILRVISRSQTDLQPAFDTILASATRLLGAYAGLLTRRTGEQIEIAALTSTDEAGDAALRAAFPHSCHSAGGHAQVLRDRAPLNVADAWIDPRVPDAVRAAARARGNHSLAIVPLLRHDEAVGAIGVTRRDAGGFTDDEIALLETFADQAVIAIENARLLSELQTRTHELTRSVEKLTALGDVVQAVSSSLDLETVLTTIVSRAVQLTGLDGGVVFEYDEAAERFVQRAAIGTANYATAAREKGVRKGEGVVGRTALTLQPVQIRDISVAGAYEGRIREDLIAAGVRALVAVPILREGRLIGGLAVNRDQPGEFEPEMIDLLRTFATQSALAIQNARLFRELELKSRELEVASQHKSEFLASMSHELRTPLNAVIGFSEVLLEKMFGDVNDKQEEYLRDIHTSAQHLLSLINDILDLSKIEAGRMDLDLADFHLPTAIDDALLLMRERAGRRGITLERHVDERLGEIRADQRKVKQVLLNLLSNAVKFTPEGSRIDVRAALVQGTVEISVTDTGIGIAPEDQEAVFEEFRQVGKADKKAEGTGLGLALCRKFVTLHGGRIWVKSQLGAGSTFTFSLPVRQGGAVALRETDD